MTPIEPSKVSTADPRSPFAPPYVDDDPEKEMVQMGLNEAEDEIRDAVAAKYEASALVSGDPEASLNDIDFTEGEENSEPSEIKAMKKVPKSAIESTDG